MILEEIRFILMSLLGIAAIVGLCIYGCLHAHEENRDALEDWLQNGKLRGSVGWALAISAITFIYLIVEVIVLRNPYFSLSSTDIFYEILSWTIFFGWGCSALLFVAILRAVGSRAVNRIHHPRYNGSVRPGKPGSSKPQSGSGK